MMPSPSTSPSVVVPGADPAAIESRIAELIPQLTRLLAEAKMSAERMDEGEVVVEGEAGANSGSNITSTVPHRSRDRDSSSTSRNGSSAYASAVSQSLARTEAQESRLHSLIDHYVDLRMRHSQRQSDAHNNRNGQQSPRGALHASPGGGNSIGNGNGNGDNIDGHTPLAAAAGRHHGDNEVSPAPLPPSGGTDVFYVQPNSGGGSDSTLRTVDFIEDALNNSDTDDDNGIGGGSVSRTSSSSSSSHGSSSNNRRGRATDAARRVAFPPERSGSGSGGGLRRRSLLPPASEAFALSMERHALSAARASPSLTNVPSSLLSMTVSPLTTTTTATTAAAGNGRGGGFHGGFDDSCCTDAPPPRSDASGSSASSITRRRRRTGGGGSSRSGACGEEDHRAGRFPNHPNTIEDDDEDGEGCVDDGQSLVLSPVTPGSRGLSTHDAALPSRPGLPRRAGMAPSLSSLVRRVKTCHSLDALDEHSDNYGNDNDDDKDSNQKGISAAHRHRSLAVSPTAEQRRATTPAVGNGRSHHNHNHHHRHGSHPKSRLPMMRVSKSTGSLGSGGSSHPLLRCGATTTAMATTLAATELASLASASLSSGTCLAVASFQLSAATAPSSAAEVGLSASAHTLNINAATTTATTAVASTRHLHQGNDGHNSNAIPGTGGGGGEEMEIVLLRRLVELRRQSPWQRMRSFYPPEIALRGTPGRNNSSYNISTSNYRVNSNARRLTRIMGAGGVGRGQPPPPVYRAPVGVTTALVPPQAKGFLAKGHRLSAPQQQHQCKGCLRRLGLTCGAVPSWDAARYCYYTGLYYCHECHPGYGGGEHEEGEEGEGGHNINSDANDRDATELRMPIPAMLLHNWDGRRMPVATASREFLQKNLNRPLWCVSAVQPSLLRSAPSLRAAHALRSQIASMRDAGVPCSEFRRLFYGTAEAELISEGMCAGGDDGDGVASLLVALATAVDGPLVPAWARYYMEDTELWSLADLIDLHKSCPDVVTTTTIPTTATVSAVEGGDTSTDCNDIHRNHNGSDREAESSAATEAFIARASSLSRARSVDGGDDTPSNTANGNINSNGVPAHLSSSSPLLQFLRSLRAAMAAHLLSCRRCRRQSTDVCRLCCPADVTEAFTIALLAEDEQDRARDKSGGEGGIGVHNKTTNTESFLDSTPAAARRCLTHGYDHLHVHRCPRCGCAYHHRCLADVASRYAAQLCGVCTTLQQQQHSLIQRHQQQQQRQEERL